MIACQIMPPSAWVVSSGQDGNPRRDTGAYNRTKHATEEREVPERECEQGDRWVGEKKSDGAKQALNSPSDGVRPAERVTEAELAVWLERSGGAGGGYARRSGTTQANPAVD